MTHHLTPPNPNFTWIQRIGYGTSGEVWHAQLHGQALAVKVFSNQAFWDSSSLERLQTSTRALAALDHPSIVKPVDAGLFRSLDQLPPIERTFDTHTFRDAFPHGCPYIAMQHFDLQTLEAHAHQAHQTGSASDLIAWPSLRALTVRILKTLAHAHARDVPHTNLKPQNILLDPNIDSLQLVDFGVSNHIDHPLQNNPLHLLTLYPEHSTSQRSLFHLSTDLYVLARILWWFASGSLPPHPHPSSPLPALRPLSPTVPTGFATWLSALTAPQPRDRPHNAASALHLLETLTRTKPPTPNAHIPTPLNDALQTAQTSTFVLPQHNLQTALHALAEHTHAQILHTDLLPPPNDVPSLRHLLVRHFKTQRTTLREATNRIHNTLYASLHDEDPATDEDLDDFLSFSQHTHNHDPSSLRASALASWMAPALLSTQNTTTHNPHPRVSFPTPQHAHATLCGFLQSILDAGTPLVLSLSNIHHSLDALRLIFYLLDPETTLRGPVLLLLTYDTDHTPHSTLHHEWLHALAHDPSVQHISLPKPLQDTEKEPSTPIYPAFTDPIDPQNPIYNIATLLGPTADETLLQRACTLAGIHIPEPFPYTWDRPTTLLQTPPQHYAQACYEALEEHAHTPHPQHVLESLIFFARHAHLTSQELHHTLDLIRLFQNQQQHARCAPLFTRCTTLLEQSQDSTHTTRHTLLLLQATTALEEQRIQDALDLLHTCAQQTRDEHDPTTLCKTLLELARATLLISDPGRAEGHLLEALLIAEQIPDEALIARAKEALGDLYCGRAEPARASIEYEDACQLFAQVGMRPELAQTRYALATAQRFLGETQRAEDSFEMALVSYETTGDRFNVACCLNALGELARASQDPVRAQHYYERALNELLAIHSKQSTRVSINLALLSLSQHHYTQAHTYLHNALDPSHNLSHPELTRIHAGLLACAAALRQWRTWDHHAAQLQPLLHQPTIHPDLAFVLDHAASMACEHNQTTRAQPILQHAISQWEALRNHKRVAHLLTLLYPTHNDHDDVPF